MSSVIKSIALWIFVILLLVSNALITSTIVSGSGDEQINQLPFCNEENSHEKDRNVGLLYVSTLDGKVSALDILSDGQKKWTVNTTPGQMISSSIHNLDLTNNGKWVRMIPSLSGSIYKFDGDSVEPIPINADNLLSSTFKFSDDLIISGGKETISYGVSAHTGRIIYECSMRGCINSTDIDSNMNENNNEIPSYGESNGSTIDDDVIVVRRQTQTVRAIEPRTGEERWNFSVGHHELESIQSPRDCHSSSKEGKEIHDILQNLELKIVVPEGLICAVRKNAPHTVLWKFKFDHPIVNVWQRDENNQLKTINLFRTAHEMWQFQGNSWTQSKAASIRDQDNEGTSMPSIYIGMFKRQLYIQESDHMRSMRTKAVDHITGNIENSEVARIPWRPIEASSSTLMQIEFFETNKNSLATTASSELASIHKKDDTETATSILYGSEYVNGNGFYLYSERSEQSICDKKNSTGLDDEIRETLSSNDTGNDFDDSDTTPIINVVSIWYWWREITLIVLSALIFQVLFVQRRTIEPEVVIVERHVEIKVPATPEPVENNFLLPAIEYHTKRSLSESNSVDSGSEAPYKSRFQTDFDMLQCLGKGGFGVVFEVKNKIDDCGYAIKRIVLPKSKQSRDRVMREVKTLANCEHHHIVRYFQAWVESPPPGWQEKEDQIWMDRYALYHSIDIDSPTEDPSHSLHPPGPDLFTKQVRSQAFNKNKLDFLISGLQTNECLNFDDVVRKTNFSSDGKSDDDDDDDSFIVFADEANEKDSELNGDLDESDTSSSDEESDNDADLSNSVFSPSSTDFKNDCNSVSNVQQKRPLAVKKNAIKNPCMKKRSFSMNDSSQAVKDNCEININFPDEKCDIISERGQENRKLPFKRTHRRPLSLDLTSTGSVQVQIPNLSTSPLSYLYIQMQLCRKQSLKDWLVENGSTVRGNESHRIFKQIVEAVEYVHLKGLIHRDLKPSNIFFSLDGQIKIGDFGLVTDMSENPKVITPCGDESGLPSCAKHTEQVGTHLYMSPEQLRGRQYNYKVDIYSLGLILFELLMVFGTEMERIETIKSLRSNKFPKGFQDNFQHEFDLLKLMLSKNPSERPTTYGIRARPPFFESTDQMYHFDLPPRRRDSQNFSSSLSSSSNNSSSVNLKSVCK